MIKNKEMWYFVGASMMLAGAFGPPEMGLGYAWQFLGWMGWL